jgi:F-type H+-transporting ATPase subunit b
VDQLGINLGFFIAQIVNFLIIFFLLAKLVWPRVVEMLDERQERIAKGLEDARAAEEKLENAEREQEKIVGQARTEGQKIVDEARKRGEEQVKQMLRDAEREAEQRRSQAQTQAEEERNRILADTRDQIVDLAMAAAQKLIGDSLDEKQQRQVIQSFFAAAPADVKNLGKQVTVTSAIPLTDDEQAEVKKVTGADAVNYRVDPAILGGLILRSGDKVVDGSVRGDLTAMSKQLRR